MAHHILYADRPPTFTMAPQRFANYPQPIDRTCADAGDASKDDNPKMTGYALSIGASLFASPFFPERQDSPS